MGGNVGAESGWYNREDASRSREREFYWALHGSRQYPNVAEGGGSPGDELVRTWLLILTASVCVEVEAIGDGELALPVDQEWTVA